MVSWKTASKDDQRRLAAITICLTKYPRLIDEIFDPIEPRLRNSPQALLRGRSSGEKILMGICLDVWNGSVGVKVTDLNILDDGNLENVIAAIKFLRSKGRDVKSASPSISV